MLWHYVLAGVITLVFAQCITIGSGRKLTIASIEKVLFYQFYSI